MADTRVTIDVDLNTSPAAQGLRDLQRQYNAFTSSLNKNNAAQAAASRQYSDQLLRMVNSSQMFTAETVKMQTAAGRLDRTLAKGQATMGQYFSARFLRNSNAAAQVLSLANARAAALQTQFFATSAAANGMRDAIAVRPYEAFNSALAVSTQRLAIHRAMLMQATTHMINFGKNTQWAGRQLMVGFTVPLTIFGGVAGKVFRDLEEQAINFKKVYGDIFTTEEETQEALDAVKELSVEFTKYGIAVRDTMELAGVAAQSGLRNAELMAATTQATRLATLGQMEQAEAMKTIISLQTAFQTSNEGLAESVDFLNIIENQTVLALRDVAGAIPRVAPVIQGLGGDVKDLAVLLVAMKEGGVSAGEGANALKTSLSRLISPTKAATDMAAEFGINLNQIVESNRGEVVPMIKELADAMQSLDGLSQQRLLSEVFGKRQFARMGALFNSITNGSSQAARAMDLINMSAKDLAATAEKELGTVEESVGARFTAAMEKAKVAIAPLGEAFLNLSIPVINMFTKIIDKFNELPDFAKKFAVFGSVLVGVVIPVGTMFLGLLMNLIGTLIKFGSIIGIAFKGFTTGGIKGAIDAVSQALNYMSLEEIDAANAAKQLGDSTLFVNEALRQQVPRSAEATTGINQLGAAYATLIARMREAAAMSASQGGAFVVPGAAAAAASRGRARGYNKGGKIRTFNEGNTVPGVGNTDTVPAMLTPGEFVVNKQATKENIGLLTAINDGSNVQFRNKGGGIAEPGRMFYGRVPRVLSADDFMAMAAKGPSELEQIAAAQAREVGIGTSSVGRSMGRASAAAGQSATQLQIRRSLDEYLSALPFNATRSSKELADELTALLRPLGHKVTNEQLSKWMRNNVGASGRGKSHTWDKTNIASFIKTLSFDRKTHGAHFGGPKLTSPQAKELVRMTNDNKIRLAKELVDAGVPVTALTDDWAELSLKLNLAASRSKNTKMNIAEAIDDLEANRDLLTVGPAMRRAGVDKDSLVDGMKKYLSEYSQKNGSDALITDEILTAARNSALSGKKVSPIVTGARVPTRSDLQDWVASKRNIKDSSSISDADIARELDRVGFDYVYGGSRQTITHRASGISDQIARSSSYERSWADIPDALKLAKGGMVPGIQYLFGGGSVLSRAAQVRRVKDANIGFMGGLEDQAVSTLFKRFRFNDVRGADSPSAFVKGMFERWETTPTRISPKENTTMLLKGKKPKYDPVTQEDYLANMIVSLDKFGDVADAFKPITVGTTPGGKARIFDGHTRLHAQTVKGLIARLTGKDTSRMSREEIVEGIRAVQSKSLAGEITDTDIMRSVAGQRVLTTTASRRETEKLFERPGKQAPMASMLNRQGRVLLPEIHGKEIEAILSAARKANFYGVGKDPESLMKAMGFVSLGGGARYRYEPKHDFRNRSSYVNNVGRRIIDDLIDAGEILPLRRNKGGMIPAIQQLGGGGRAVELLRSYMAGNFDVMRNPATRKQVLSLGETMTGTLYRGTQIGAGTLPKHVERALLQAEKTGDYSKLIGKKFKMRSSDWSRSESTAQRFTQMNSVKDRQNFLNYERNLTTRQIDDAQRYIEQAESGRLAFVNQQKLDQSRKSLPMLRQDLERINRELGEIGELAPVLIKAKGAMKGVDASRIAPDATYMGRPISESNVIASGGMFQIKSASSGNLEIVPVQRRNEGGEIFESGSRTTVPGVGNTDTVPAMLTPGEFVINKKATRENKSLLQSINNGNSLNQGGRVQFLNTGNPVSDWGDFTDPAEQKPSKKERFERSAIGRYAGQRLAAGERSGVLLGTIRAMRMNVPMTGIVVQELLDYENLSPKQQMKERNLRKAEAGAAKYEKAMQFWHSNGRPAPPPEVRSNAEKAVSGQRVGAAAGSGMSASTVPGGAPANDYVYGYDKNNRPITNWHNAAKMAFNGSLFDTDGNKVPPKDVRMIRRGTPPPAVADDAPKQRFGMTRAQRIWAVISALTMAGTATGITLNERNENRQEQEGLRFNAGGKVPAMLTPGEFVVDRDKAENNLGLLHAINGGMKLNKGGQIPGYAVGGAVAGAAKFMIPMGLSIPGGMYGAEAGEAVAGDSGAMIGGMAGGMLPFALAALPFGRMFGRRGGAPEKAGPDMLLNTTAGAGKTAAAANTTAKSMLSTTAQFLKLGRIIPLLFNPYTALAAAVVAATYTLYKMNEGNKAEYEAGRKFADAMTTTADEITMLGQSAKERAQNISSYLDQSESSFIEQKYNKKIAKAKDEREKLALKKEKREAMREAGGETTRRSTVRAFYDSRIAEMASAGASVQERQNIYAQRNAALAAERLSGINLDPKFGKQFIEGTGQEIFEEFKATRRLGMQGGANFKYAEQMARAAYGETVSITEAAARDLGAKLSQYVLSGVMTEDEASSVAAAISQELEDARIGKTIRDEILTTVGADGLKAQYDPAGVAMKLAERDERRLESTRKSLFELMNRFGGAGTTPTQGAFANMAGGLIVGQGIKDIVSANRKNNAEQQIPIAQQKQLLLPSFFMGDADEMRRQLGSVIEMQTAQMQMLEENIASVSLAYNDMILKADTLTKKKDLEMEKSLAIARLQEKQDAAREEQFAMFGGSDSWIKQSQESIEKATKSLSSRVDARTNLAEQSFGEAMALPVNWGDISALGSNIVNTGKQLFTGLGSVTANLVNATTGAFESIARRISGTILDPTGGQTFGEVYTEQALEAVRKKFEGTSAGAALETFLEEETVKRLEGGKDPAFVSLYNDLLNNGEEYANAILGSYVSIKGALEFATSNVNEFGVPLQSPGMETKIEGYLTTLTSGITLEGNQALTQEGRIEAMQLVGSMASDLQRGGDDLIKTFDLLTQHPMFTGEQAGIATERWANFVNQTRELTAIALEDGRTLYDELIEDEQFIEVVLTDDQFFKDYLNFVDWLNEQAEDTKIAIRTEIENADDATQVVEDLVANLAEFDPAKANKKFRDFIKQFSSLEMGDEFSEEIARITRGLRELNKIEDPEIKAKLLAEIDPNVDLLLRLMNQLSQDPGNVDLQNQLLDVAQDLNVSARASLGEEEGEKKPKGGGGGGSGEDPLNALMRQLRDTTDQLASIGMEMLSVGRESKSIFAKLRDQGVNEVVIDYLKSMSPEEAIKVGNDLLNNEKKLNTIMQQAGEVALARQQDAKMVAEARAGFARELLRSGKDSMGLKALSGAPLLDMQEALNDPEFIEGMMAARGTAKPNRAMREFQQTYFGRRQAERRSMFNMAPAIIQSQAQQNFAQTYAANQLRARGLSEEQVQTALESEAIMNRIRGRLEQGKAIGPVITEMTKELYASTRTAMSILDDGINKVGGVFDFLSQSLNNAMQQIDKFTIKPLQEEIEDIQEETSEFSESQRRLSRALSNLAEDEKDLKEQQKEKEEEINDAYDLRIKALEKVNDINQDIEDRQQGQLTVADALSRGDIAAAAKAAQEMQAKAAQSRREEALQAMRDQKEEDMQSLKESHEEELERLTISVNGELLTREQIQEKIDELDEKIYQNSLREYDIQQKINDAMEQRRKIEDQIEKTTLATQAINQIGAINQETDIGERQRLIEGAKQTVQLIGGPESERLIQVIDENMQGLLSQTGSTEFSAAMQNITGEFGPLLGDIGANVQALNINIPGIQSALDTAINTATTALPDIFTGIKDEITNLNNQIAVDPESDDNPFAKVYKAAKKVAAKIEAAFANIKPPPGSGGGGPDEEEPEAPTREAETDQELPAAVIKNVTGRKGLRSRTDTITLADGRKARVTNYYDISGNLIPGFTKYELTEPTYQTGAGVQQVFTGREFQSRGDFISAGGTQFGQGIEMDLPYRISGSARGFGEPPGQRKTDMSRINYAMYDADFAVADIASQLSQETGVEIGNDILMGVAQGVVDASIAYNENAIREALIQMMEIQVEASSPARAMFPVGGYVASGLIQGAINWFTAPAKFIWDSIKSYFESETGTENGDSTKTESTGASLLNGMLNGLVSALIPSSLWTPVWTWIKEAFGMTSDAEEELEKTKPAGASIISGIFGGITSFLTPGKLWSSLWTWISGDTTSDVANTNNTSTGNKIISGIFNGITTFLTPGKLWSKIWSWISGDFSEDSEAPDNLMSVGGEGSNGTKGIMGGIKDGIIDWIENTSFAQFINDVIDGFNKALGEKNIIDGLSSIGGAIWKLIGDAVIAAIPGGQFASTMVNFVSSAVRRMYGGVIPKMAYGGMVNFKGSREPAPGMMMGGKVKKYAAGGFVPGIGMTDKVPALLTPGEFVVRKSVAQQMLPTLKDMNSQVFPGMGVPQQRSLSVSSPQFDTMKKMSVDQVRFGIPQTLNSFTYPTTNMNMTQSNTDMSPTNNNVGPTNVQYTYNLSVNANTNASPDDIANTVMYKIKRFDDRKIRGTQVG